MDEPRPPLPFSELLQRARANQRLALDELFRLCQSRLERLSKQSIARAPHTGARASDHLQELVVLVMNKLPQFRGTTEAAFFSWVETLSSNLTNENLRANARQKRDIAKTVPLDDDAMDVPSPQKSPSQVTALRQSWKRVLKCLVELPEEQREAIRCCHLEQMTVIETAEHLGKTPQAVASLMQRGLKTLREELTGEGSSAQETDPSWQALEGALLLYFQKRDAGERLDPETFIAQHPHCEKDLRTMLELLHELQAIKPPQKQRERSPRTRSH